MSRYIEAEVRDQRLGGQGHKRLGREFEFRGPRSYDQYLS